MSNDELQKAIDDITSGDAGVPADDNNQDAAVEMPTDMSAMEQTMPEPAMPIPEPVAAPAMPDLGTAPAPSMPQMDTTSVASTANPLGGGDDLEAIKNEALIALYPLLSLMNIQPKQRFDICMKVVEKTGDKGAISVAFEAAKEFSDPKDKGVALMKIIDKIESL